MRQRRREARARPTLPARPAAGGASCAVPREGTADVTPSPGLGGRGPHPAQPWGRGAAGLSLGAPGEAADREVAREGDTGQAAAPQRTRPGAQ